MCIRDSISVIGPAEPDAGRGVSAIPAAEGAESPLPVVLYNLFGDAQHVFRVGRQAVAVVDAAADEPYDLVA